MPNFLSLETGKAFCKLYTSMSVKLFSFLVIFNIEGSCGYSSSDRCILRFLPQPQYCNIDVHSLDARQTRRDTPVKLNIKLIEA